MILKGNQRGYGQELAVHLLNVEDNEHAVIHELRGFVSDDLAGAFKEAEAVSLGTKCQQYLFSFSLNPPQTAKVSVEEFEAAIADIERRLGLTGQPRAIVFHEKKGRRHAHCVWSRIDAAKMRAINLSHYKYRLRDISRELYRSHDWEMPDGLRDPKDRDPQNYSAEEAGQAKRAKRDPKELKRLFKGCWAASDSRSAFASALWEHGLCLAQGDRRGFVAVGADGEVYSVSRWCGVKAKDVRARFGDPSELPTVEEAVALLNGIAPERPTDEQAESSFEAFEAKRGELVVRQREERHALEGLQAVRRIAELQSRQKSLPTGLKAIWARMSGQYQRIVEALAEDAAACDRRDAFERQTLIDRHLSERRALERTAQSSDLSRKLSELFETALKPDPRQKLVLPPEQVGFTRDQLIQKPDLILGHLSHKRARFSELDIKRALAEFIDDPLVLRPTIDKALASKDLVRIEGASDFTTRDYHSAEQTLFHLSAKMSGSLGARVAHRHIERAISTQDFEMQRRFGGSLSDEQKQALHHILGDKRLSCVVGLAGSGKSTMLATAKDAWERQGIKVHGAALAGKAADELAKSSGIEGRTLASLEASWKNGYEPIKPGEVLVVDEAGMIGTRQLMRVTKKLQEIGASLVLLGDPGQLQPIEAGTPFRKLVETHGAMRLTEIHRQRQEWQRQASRDLADGRIREAVNAYDVNGCVTSGSTRNGALAALVENYLTDVELNGSAISRLAFAHRRKDVYALNQAIRAGLRHGDPEPETLFTTETGPRAFAVGERIVFTRNDKSIGVKNGMLGTVCEVGERQLSVELDNDDGKSRRVSFDPCRYSAFDHGYAVTIHKSQGATVEESYVLASRTLDKPLTYVALTRHRQDMKLFVSEKDKPAWMEVAQHYNLGSRRRQRQPSR